MMSSGYAHVPQLLLETHQQLWEFIHSAHGDLNTFSPDQMNGLSSSITYIGQPELVLKRLDIYKRNTRGGFINALNELFPVSRQLMGESCFNTLVNNYLDVTQNASTDVGQIGVHLQSFMQQTGTLHASYPYLHEMIHLESAWDRVGRQYCAVLKDFTFIELLPIAQQCELIFHTVPALEVHEYQYPVHTLWRWHQNQEISCRPNEIDALELADMRMRCSKASRYWVVVFAQAGQGTLTCIDSEQVDLLCMIQQGLSLATMIEMAFEKGFAHKINGFLKHFIQAGWLSHTTFN